MFKHLIDAPDEFRFSSRCPPWRSTHATIARQLEGPAFEVVLGQLLEVSEDGVEDLHLECDRCRRAPWGVLNGNLDNRPILIPFQQQNPPARQFTMAQGLITKRSLLLRPATKGSGCSQVAALPHLRIKRPLQTTRLALQATWMPIFERELELIKPDLHNHVVMDFGLSEKSQGRLHNFTTIMNKLPGISKELAVPLFYIMGVLLCILDALDARSSGQTTITPEELGTVYKKIEEKLELSTFRMNEMQRTNATATIKAMVFAKGRLEFHNTKDRAMQLFEDEKASRGFLTAFENHANEEELRGAVSSIAHSVLNGFREDLIMSVCRGSKGRAVSLPSAVQTMGKKFLGRSSLVERDHLKKVALLRRLIMENTELHSDKHLKRGPDGELFFQIPRLEPAVLEGFPDEPEHDDLPPKPQGTVGFWALVDWMIQCLRVRNGSNDSDRWVAYFQQIIEDDLAIFPTEEKTMTGASDIVAMAQSRPRASTVQASGSRQQDTPSVNYNSLTL
ncbi:hypothetical protein DFP72DRAFT_1072392 [Ephemerocybe angulata]|uniref:Uncharacterized protein n=1 Tax=Ephemerocybe angulata TaxID=980116 RepID=A0A8H6HR58_9AGAR|nr:hypothetical protein DFP72DRAFT_1072392 [Tulosesus angulatus]